MKEMNRREFLTLTGAAVVALSLAGCGGPSAPPAPSVPTGKEDIVLEAINKYRGTLPPLTPDSGLDPAMELVVKIAKGEMKLEDSGEALDKAADDYIGVGAPIGMAFNKDTGYMMPVCVYSDSAEQMEQNLLLLGDESGKASLSSPAIKLVNIKTFEYKGTTFWVAVVVEGKK